MNINLNLLFPLFGALIPSLLQAKKTIIIKRLEDDYFGRFTLNLIYAVFILMVSCLTIHSNILNNVIYLGEMQTYNGSHEIVITLLHYIIIIGLGIPLLLMLAFNSFVEASAKKINSTGKMIMYSTVSILLVAVSIDILFVQSFLNFK